MNNHIGASIDLVEPLANVGGGLSAAMAGRWAFDLRGIP